MSRNEILKLLSEHLGDIEERFGATGVALFGSVVRGDARPESDVDVLVDLPDSRHVFAQYVGLKSYLEDLLARRVDLAPRGWLREHIRTAAEAEAVPVPQAAPGEGTARTRAAATADAAAGVSGDRQARAPAEVPAPEVSRVRRDAALELLSRDREAISSRFEVQSLALFGSVARDEATADSDVDLLVQFKEMPDFRRYMGLKLFLEDLLGARVDLVMAGALRPEIRPFVEAEAVRVA